MTTSVIASSGGDYATWSAWEAAISANPSTEEVGEQRDANDLGAVTINVSNTNNVDIKMTVQDGNGYRFYEQTGWPNCAIVEGAAARIEKTNTCVSVATNNVIVEWLVLSPTTSFSAYGCQFASGANNSVIRNCCIWATRSAAGNKRGVRTSYDAGGATTNTISMYYCFLWGCNRAVWAIDNAMDIENVTIHCAGLSPTGSFGINKQNNGGTGNAVTVNNCKVVSDDLDNDYVATTGSFTSSDNNIDSDGSAPGTTTYTLAPEAVIYNPNIYEEDLHGISAALGREWPANLDGGWSGEANDLTSQWSTITNVAVGTGGAWRGTYGGTCTVTGGGTIAARWSPEDSGTTNYLVIVFRLRSGWSMGSGESFDFMETRRTGGAQVTKMNLSESGGNYVLTPITINPSAGSGTTTNLTVGTWYVVKIKLVFEVSGEATIWVGPAGGTLTQVINTTGNLSGNTFARFDWLGVASANASGSIDFDHLTLTTTDTREADDSTSPFGTDNDGSYIGGTPTWSTDIDGNAVDTNDIGAHDYSVAAAGGTKSDNRMLLLGVGR